MMKVKKNSFWGNYNLYIGKIDENDIEILYNNICTEISYEKIIKKYGKISIEDDIYLLEE